VELEAAMQDAELMAVQQHAELVSFLLHAVWDFCVDYSLETLVRHAMPVELLDVQHAMPVEQMLHGQHVMHVALDVEGVVYAMPMEVAVDVEAAVDARRKLV